MKRERAATVAAYIAAAPRPARAMLRQLRAAIRAVAPDAEEKISYRMPYYAYHGRLVYFAAFTSHVSLFILGRATREFARELAKYKTSTGTVQFPIGAPIPVALVRRMVKARVKENEARAKAKGR
jgi:uncharacterized protein YdhG (YjbR/CyaY superfamily)